MNEKLLNFLWVPFMKNIAIDIGFRTPNAQMVFRLGIDHHRSRQVLESCRYALSKELLIPYIRHCVANEVQPTSSGYLSWYDQDVQNQNYAYIFHVTFSYLLSFQLYLRERLKSCTTSLVRVYDWKSLLERI